MIDIESIRELLLMRDVVSDGMSGICIDVTASETGEQINVVLEGGWGFSLKPETITDHSIEGRIDASRRRKVEVKRIFMTVQRDWQVFEVEDEARTMHSLPPGRYEMERVQNPLGCKDAPWLVLKGTQQGATEGSWRQWVDATYGPNHPRAGERVDPSEFDIIIELV